MQASELHTMRPEASGRGEPDCESIGSDGSRWSLVPWHRFEASKPSENVDFASISTETGRVSGPKGSKRRLQRFVVAVEELDIAGFKSLPEVEEEAGTQDRDLRAFV